MKIESLKDFEKLVKLCRKLGVDTVEADGVKFQLGSEPRPKKTPVEFLSNDPLEHAKIEIPDFKDAALPTPQNETQAIADKIATDGLTDEQLLFYSARQEPGQDNPQ